MAAVLFTVDVLLSDSFLFFCEGKWLWGLEEGADVVGGGAGGVEGPDVGHLYAAALHPSEPGHLPLGKLVNSDLEVADQLLIRPLADDVLGHILVFQSVVDELLRSHLLQEPLYLLDHALLQTAPQASRYACSPDFARDIDAKDRTPHWWAADDLGRFALLLEVPVHLYGSDESAGVLRILYGETPCLLLELLEGAVAELLAQLEVFGCRTQLVATHQRLHIQSRTATQYRRGAVRELIQYGVRICEVAVEVVPLPRRTDVDEVVGYPGALHGVLAEVFAGTEVHTPVHLPGVSTQDAASQQVCQLRSHRSLAGSCGTCDGDEVGDGAGAFSG